MRSWPASVSETGPTAGGRMPRKPGWSSGNPIRPPPGAGVAHTGSFWRSASATAASQPPLASMSGPATRTGFDAFASRSPRSAIAAGSGAARPATERRIAWPAASSSTSAAQSSIGIETNVGPSGGSEAWWIAWASASGVSSARGTSKLRFTSGCGIRIASRLVRFACIVIIERACWPAVRTTGEWLAWALKIAPIALPTPGAVWRFTSVGRPEACAKPSAMPTTTASWSPST